DLENLSVTGPAEPYEAIENTYPGSKKYSRYRMYAVNPEQKKVSCKKPDFGFRISVCGENLHVELKL
ncbi:MAG: hypothetical protein ACOCWO_01300, partial [Candidatus Muiribacteriaceae bacterium]